MMTKLEALIVQFEKAVNRLGEALAAEKNDFMRDSCIQRFEFCFDLSWKLIKSFLEEKKEITCKSPVSCFKEAYIQNLIEYDDAWIQMGRLRNRTSHTYHEELAEAVYSTLPGALHHFQKLLKKIRDEVV